ncbi:uncharacterized protein LOC117226303 isoform X2 [Megalopta genalis]|uniref:uncharacterized protein LOC117226303 isoform X2 n=1 Tax=Megalopta genalis TaxID=115081 RepID=UPI003FD32DAF
MKWLPSERLGVAQGDLLLSTESSPATTTKLKRRVSFAETKHVKEFCNSLEQGTVWNNTYEEHDISNLNVLCIPNKECDVGNVCKTNVEIRTDHYNEVRYSNSQTVDKLAITDTRICFTRDEIIQESLIAIDHEEVCRSISRKTESTYKQPTKKGMLLDASSIINCNITAQINEHAVLPGNTNDDSMEITTVVSTKPYTLQETNMYQQDTRNFNDVPKEMAAALITGLCNLQRETSYAEPQKNCNDVSMEMTTTVPTIPCNLQKETLFAERTKNLKDVSMEMTTAVPTKLCSLQQDTPYTECTKNFKDVSMEITAVVPTKPYNLQQVESNPMANKNYNDVSMEVTTIVPTISCNLQKGTLLVERTKNLTDVTMEMTTAVPTKLCSLQQDTPYAECTKNLKDVSVEMTTAVPTKLCSLQQDTPYVECTKNFKDVSMEITAVVPTKPYNLQQVESNAMANKNYNDVSMELTSTASNIPCNLQSETLFVGRTNNLKDVSMEMTTTVPTIPCNLQKETLFAERTKNLKDVSMEMTTAVPTKLCNLQQDTPYAECIKNFKDVSMEITAVVPTKPYNLQQVESNPMANKNYNDVSMEVTTIVPTISCNLQKGTLLVERTKNLTDVTMEMTTAVPTKLCSLQQDTPYAECTKNLKDVSMEMTTAVPTKLCSLQQDTPYVECTKNFKDVSMEITAVVPTKPYNLQQVESNAMANKNYNDVSMEVTTIVPTISCNLQKGTLLVERTKNLTDVTMEMTTAVPTKLCSLQQDTPYVECTKNFKDVSMEITAVVPTKPYNLQQVESNAMANKNYNDVSMEVTTIVPTISCNLQKGTLLVERTKNLTDVTMEMTTAVPTKLCSLQQDTPYAECTKNFKDVSMEITAVVPTKPCNLQQADSNAKANKNYNDVSVQMTSTAPTIPCNLQNETLFAGCTNNLKDVSMEMTTTVPTIPCNLQKETFLAGRTKILKDVSMEMTTAVPTILCSLQQDSPYMEHTKNFKDVSMEMTVAVPIESHNLQEEEPYATSNKNHNNVSIDTTTAVPTRPCTVQKGTLCREHTKNFKDVSMEMTVAVQTKLCSLQRDASSEARIKVTYDLQEVRHNNDKTSTICHDASVDVLQMHSCDLNMESDKNKIVGDNLMAVTAVVPFLNQMNVSEERVEYCDTNIQKSEEVAVPPLHNIPERTDAVTNLSEVRQTILPEKVDNRTSSRNSLNQITTSDNVLKDITILVVPSLLNSSESSKEKNCTINKSENSEDKIIKEPTSSELPNLVNIETHTAMHDSLMQDICASALNKDNTGSACATLNTASNDFLCTVMPDVSQGTFLSHEHSQDILPHPRRTYTIKPLSIDHSFPNTSNEHSKNLGTSHDVQDVNSFQTQASFENCSTFFDRTVEQLESIKPPSFLCLDNSVEDVSVNTNYGQEVETEKEIVSSLNIIEGLPGVTKCRETQKLDLQEVVNESGKQNSLETSHFRLLHGGSPSTIVKDLECSSSTMNNSQIISTTINVISPSRNEDTHSNSNIENETMEQSVVDKDLCKAYTEENHLQSDELKLHKITMEIELEEIDPQTSLVDKDVTIELDPFSSLLKELRACAESDNIIWEIYHENIEKKMFIAGFMSCSLLLVIYLRDDYDDVLGSQFIKDVKMISRLADDAGDLISIVHKLILEKIDVRKLIDLYKSVNDILLMLDHVSKEVKLAMEFMFELDRLKDRNLMDITRDSVSFVSLTKKMDIILRVTVILKPFENIESEDISVQFLSGSSGSVREEVIKKLLKNIKKDHNFLRRFINDVRDYIYLMEVCDAPTKVPY